MTLSRRRIQSPGHRSNARTQRSFPVFTIGLIAVGSLVYCIFPGAGRSAAACLYMEDLGVMNLVLVAAAMPKNGTISAPFLR